MPGAIILVIIAAFVLVRVIGSFADSSDGGRSMRGMDSVLKPICERFGAAPEHPGKKRTRKLRRPGLLFNYGRTMVRLRHLGSKWKPATQHTEIAMNFRHRSKNPLWAGLKHGTAIRRQGLTILPVEDDAAFLREWTVLTDDLQTGTELLTATVRWKLMELSNSTCLPTLRVVVSDQHLRVTCDSWIDSGQKLMDLTQGTMDIFDQLMLIDAEGLKFVNATSATVIGEVRCPICSDDVMQDMVLCRRCKTPHCSECWEYNGKCATFACMENRCVRVTSEPIDV